MIKKDNIYPCTIIADRYGGIYSSPIPGDSENSMWVALYRNYYGIPSSGPDGSDRDCIKFWETYAGLCGHGSTPEVALEDLIRQLSERKNQTYDEIFEKIVSGYTFKNVLSDMVYQYSGLTYSGFTATDEAGFTESFENSNFFDLFKNGFYDFEKIPSDLQKKEDNKD